MKQNNIEKFIKYCLVGGCSTFIDWCTYALLYLCLGINYLPATTCGFIIGLITNFILSKEFVFTQASKYKHEFIIYGIIGLIGLVITAILMIIFVDLIALNALLARAITTILVLFWNYLARKMLY